MMIRTCKKCKSPFNIDDEIVVFGIVKCLNQQGHYNIWTDFIPNQQIYHLECWNDNLGTSDIEAKEGGRNHDDEEKMLDLPEPSVVSEDLVAGILDIDPKAKKKQVISFVEECLEKNPDDSTEEIVRAWFRERNTL